MCFQRSSERIAGKSRPPQSGWKIVPQWRTGCRETPIAKFVVCSWHKQLPDVVGDMGLKHAGGAGDESPEFGLGDANANCAPKFRYFSKFQAPDCLHYNAVESLNTPTTLTSYSLYFPKVTSTKSLRYRIHPNTPFQV